MLKPKYCIINCDNKKDNIDCICIICSFNIKCVCYAEYDKSLEITQVHCPVYKCNTFEEDWVKQLKYGNKTYDK